MQKAGADFSNNFISEAEKNVILFRLFGYRSCISVKLGKGEKDYFGLAILGHVCFLESGKSIDLPVHKNLKFH